MIGNVVLQYCLLHKFSMEIAVRTVITLSPEDDRNCTQYVVYLIITDLKTKDSFYELLSIYFSKKIQSIYINLVSLAMLHIPLSGILPCKVT